jgi:diguanylate cyclase
MKDKVPNRRLANLTTFKLTGANARYRARNDELEAENARLLTLSERDGLTGVYNRAHWDKILKQVIDNANAGKLDNKRIVMLFLDVGKFKQYNDAHGHKAGDDLLKDVASTTSTIVRRSQLGVRYEDVVARYGGDEFTILWVDEGAQKTNPIKPIAQRIKDAQRHPVTIGFVSISGEEIRAEKNMTPDKLTSMADQIMYLGKKDHNIHGLEWAKHTGNSSKKIAAINLAPAG